MSLHTLRAMANGGIYDQVGGGFARYAVDARWIVPHFEKMLYDNALLARAYLHGWQATGDALLRRVSEETLDFMLRELRQEEGGFASALDADSEGVEGKFYVWSARRAPRSPARRRRACFGMTAEGNWEGANIPVRATPDPPDLAELKAALLERARAARAAGARRQAADLVERARDLRARRRRRRARPRGLPRRRARVRRRSCSTTMRDDDGRLLRTYNRGAGAAGAPTSRTTATCSRRC